MKVQYYVQCRLKKFIEPGRTAYRVGWIPEKFASKGRVLKLKIHEQWDNGWEVIDTWERVTKEDANERSQYYKTQRLASDI
jgi:hypothetical protein